MNTTINMNDIRQHRPHGFPYSNFWSLETRDKHLFAANVVHTAVNICLIRGYDEIGTKNLQSNQCSLNEFAKVVSNIMVNLGYHPYARITTGKVTDFKGFIGSLSTYVQECNRDYKQCHIFGNKINGRDFNRDDPNDRKFRPRLFFSPDAQRWWKSENNHLHWISSLYNVNSVSQNVREHLLNYRNTVAKKMPCFVKRFGNAVSPTTVPDSHAVLIQRHCRGGKRRQ